MNHSISKKKIALVLSLAFFSLFLYLFLISPSDDSLTGYVVVEDVRVNTEKIDPTLIQEIQSGNNQPQVVILLEDNPETISPELETKKQAIKELQKEVLTNLEDQVTILKPEEKTEILTPAGTASQEEINQELVNLPDALTIINEKKADFEVTQKFETLNAFSGKINAPRALLELTKDQKVKKILLDYPVHVTLDQSIPRIKANQVWNLSLNNQSIIGAGETICVIDTGIDFTHPALGGCNPLTYELNGNLESLPSPLESSHPYTNDFDHTWIIRQPNYSNIAVHFVNISLEAIPGSGDTLDRLYLYDQNYNTLAIYKESLTNVWSPYGAGDTLYLRLVTDSSVTDYGFYIDQVINGTTNTTLNWTSCPKVIGGWDAYNNDANPKDDQGHGTHVAGIIASANETYRGVAPQAGLVAIKALSASGSGHSSDVVAGIDWCNTNAQRLNISSISMSLGCAGASCLHYQTYCSNDLTSRAIQDSYQQNLSVFIAVGNSGWTDGISNPACVKGAIPVGAVNSQDEILYNRGRLLQLLTPGTNIHSTTLSSSWLSLSGTSMATPHAAGAAALFRQYWRLAYNLTPTPSQIKEKLFLTGKKINDSAGSGLTFSRLNLLAALQPFLNFTSPTPASQTLLTANHTSIHLTSDVPLKSSLLVWAYPKGTTSNFTMLNQSSLEFSYSLSNLSSGTHSYTAYGYDLAGTQAQTQTRTLTIILGLPTLTITSPLNNSYHRQDFYLAFSLNGSQLDTLNYNLTLPDETLLLTYTNTSLQTNNVSVSHLINLSNPSFTDEQYRLTIFINDSAGNSLTRQQTFTIDTTLPSLTNLTHTPFLIYENTTLIFTLNATDLNLNNSAIYFSSNHSLNWTNYSMNLNEENTSLFNYTFSLSNLTLNPTPNQTNQISQTNHTLFYQFYALDLANNKNSSPLLNLTILPLNLTSNQTPAAFFLINITSPANGSILEVGANLTFTATTNLSGNLTYFWDFGDRTTSPHLTPTKQYLSTGNYSVSFNASNSSHSESTSLSLIINDTQPPIITSLNYFSEFHLSQQASQIINATFFDYSNLSSAELYYNNTLQTITSQTSQTYLWQFNPLQAGEHNFTLQLTDSFNPPHSQNHTYSFTTTSCSDEIKNGNETDTDCGGSCPACPSTEIAAASPEPTPSEPAFSPPKPEPQATEDNLALAAETAPPEPALLPPVNYTSDLKETKLKTKEKALYILGSIIAALSLFYFFLSSRRQGY